MSNSINFNWNAKELNKWQQTRTKGKMRYILKQICLFWLPYFVGVNMFFFWNLYNESWQKDGGFWFTLIVLSLTAIAIGCVIGQWRWKETEKSYQQHISGNGF